MSFRVMPIEADIANHVRRDRRSPQYGHPAHVEPSSGSGPCRQCLQLFAQTGERRILFTYSPVREGEGVPQPGPVFVHEEACTPFAGEGFPPDLAGLPLLFEAVGASSLLVKRVRPAARALERTITELFADPAIDVIHVRNAEAGCFMARVERR